MATSIFKQNFPGTAALQAAADTADWIIGLDLHEKTTAMCVVNRRVPDTPVLQRKRLKNAELLAKLQSFPGKKVIACEAAYGWFLLRAALCGLPGVTFVPLDARKTSSWIATSGIKNDRIDAQVLCHACLHGAIGRLAVHQPGRSARECYKFSKHRDMLVRQRTRALLQLRALAREYGPNPYSGEIPEKSALVTALEADLCAALLSADERIARVEEQMRSLSKADAVIQLLRTIPGVGPTTAFALRHKIETIDRFKDAAHLSSYFGFGVRQRQSGDTLVKGKIAKAGDALVRTLLIQGAQVIRFRHPDLIHLYFPTLGQAALMQDRRHANKVVTALARKHLTFVYHVWKHGRPFDLEQYRERRRQADALASNGARERSSSCTGQALVQPQAAELVS